MSWFVDIFGKWKWKKVVCPFCGHVAQKVVNCTCNCHQPIPQSQTAFPQQPPLPSHKRRPGYRNPNTTQPNPFPGSCPFCSHQVYAPRCACCQQHNTPAYAIQLRQHTLANQLSAAKQAATAAQLAALQQAAFQQSGAGQQQTFAGQTNAHILNHIHQLNVAGQAKAHLNARVWSQLSAQVPNILKAWIDADFDESKLDEVFNQQKVDLQLEAFWTNPQGEDMQVRAARIWYDEEKNAYSVATPYSREFVDWFKANVPSEHRAFDPESKIWSCSPQMVEKVHKQAIKIFHDCHFTKKIEQTMPAHITQGVFEDFCRLLGAELLAEVYRKAAYKHHPDRGGNAQVMSQLNQLWNEIKRVVN